MKNNELDTLLTRNAISDISLTCAVKMLKEHGVDEKDFFAEVGKLLEKSGKVGIEEVKKEIRKSLGIGEEE